MNLEELYNQELNSKEAFNESFIKNDSFINEVVDIVNEAYIGKTPILEEIEDLISQIRGKLNKYQEFDRMKEVQAINRLFEKQFGMDVFALHLTRSNEINAGTEVVAANFDVYKDKNFHNYLVADRKDGFRFRPNNNFCIIVSINYGVLSNPDITDGEIMAIILHEIGHNFADFIDDNIMIANQYSMDIWIVGNILRILLSAITLQFRKVGSSVANLVYGLTSMNNARTNRKERKNIKGKERVINPAIKGVVGSTKDFFSVAFEIFKRYNIIYLGYKGAKRLFIKPFENYLKKSAKQSTDRRNEIIADKFAVVYGYGPERSSVFIKYQNIIAPEKKIIAKLPFGKKFNDAWDKLYLDINDFDCHPHDVQRMYECIKTLKDELNQEDMDPKLKSVIQSQINDIESNINIIKSMVNEDPNNIKLAYSAYVAKELPDATTKAIEDEINQELNDILRECTFDFNNEIITEGFWNQAVMGYKIHPHQNLEETLKKHEYPGILNFAKKQKDIGDLKYLRQDAYIGIKTVEKIKIKIQDNDTKNKYVKAGITIKDCDLTIKWFKEVYIKAINDKIKELKSK